MEIKIIEEKPNELFSRKEIKLEILSNVTPSHAEVEKLISEKFNTDADKIKIKDIQGKFGVQKFIVNASVYDSKEDKDNFEIKTKKQRDAEKKSRIEEEKKLAEEKKAAAEAAKAQAEKPVEEVKEENKEDKTE